MGKLLVIKGADFSANGIQIVDHALKEIRNAIENTYKEHLRFQSSYGSMYPNIDSNNRNAFGCFDASSFQPFVITPKAGCKIAPLQWHDTSARFRPIAWETSPVVFSDFSTLIYVGANVAYTDDSNIPDNTSVWDFIDVALVPA